MMDAYTPISCDFYDELEALATLRQECTLNYHNEANELVEVRGLIVDIYAAHKADFLKLKDGTEIRLDQVISVNDKVAANYSD